MLAKAGHEASRPRLVVNTRSGLQLDDPVPVLAVRRLARLLWIQEIHEHRSQFFSHLRETGIAPFDQRPAVLWQDLELGKRLRCPDARSEDNGNQNRVAPLTSLQRPANFHVSAVLRGEKMVTDQEEDHVSGGQVLVDDVVPLVAGSNPAVMPCRDEPVTLQ